MQFVMAHISIEYVADEDGRRDPTETTTVHADETLVATFVNNPPKQKFTFDETIDRAEILRAKQLIVRCTSRTAESTQPSRLTLLFAARSVEAVPLRPPTHGRVRRAGRSP